MSAVSNVGRRLFPAFVSAAILAILQPGEAIAGRFEDALALVRTGDIERIEQSFAADYQAFVDGTLSNPDFVTPYDAFYTLDPVVLDMIAEWRAAKPESAYARVAEVGPKMHLAIVLRGESILKYVPRKSFERAWKLWTESVALYSEALDRAPLHLRAASGLRDAAQYLGDDRRALRGKRVLAAHGSQVALLLNELHAATPQWGGSEAKMRRLCDTIAPKVEGITVAECHARATLLLWNQPEDVRNEAVEVLRREHEEANRFTIARELIESNRAEEALALYDDVDAWIPGSLADDFALALRNYAVQERIVDRWLAINPLTPRLLAMKSEAQAERGDFAGAAETIEKAMIYGETIPEVRDMRLGAMMHDKSRNQDVLGEFEDALVDTDFHPLVMERAVAALVWNPEPIRHWSDGSEHSRFQCRRARILSDAFNSCGRHWNRQGTLGCTDSTLKRAMEMLGEVDLGSCADIGRLQ
jgi:tetratricopeptide (TPR) repeat protein